jgi:hypothetical protein
MRRIVGYRERYHWLLWVCIAGILIFGVLLSLANRVEADMTLRISLVIPLLFSALGWAIAAGYKISEPIYSSKDYEEADEVD